MEHAASSRDNRRGRKDARGTAPLERGGKHPTLTVSGHLDAGRFKQIHHVLRIEITGPDGTSRAHYATNLTVNRPRFSLHIPLALNETPGTWHVRARDVATGEVAAIVLDSD